MSKPKGKLKPSEEMARVIETAMRLASNGEGQELVGFQVVFSVLQPSGYMAHHCAAHDTFAEDQVSSKHLLNLEQAVRIGMLSGELFRRTSKQVYADKLEVENAIDEANDEGTRKH